MQKHLAQAVHTALFLMFHSKGKEKISYVLRRVSHKRMERTTASNDKKVCLLS